MSQEIHRLECFPHFNYVNLLNFPLKYFLLNLFRYIYINIVYKLKVIPDL